MTDATEIPTFWADLPYHRRWLAKEAEGLMDFFQYRAINPKAVSTISMMKAIRCRRKPCPRHSCLARMVHCFSIAYMLGRPAPATSSTTA